MAIVIVIIAAILICVFALKGSGDKVFDETAVETEAEISEEQTEEESEPEEEEESAEKEQENNVGEIPEGGKAIIFSESQNKAKDMPEDTKLYGTISDGYYWFAFTAGKATDTDYQMTLINKTPSSYKVYANVYNEYGSELSSAEADDDGRAVTVSMGDLEPKTTYYIRMSSHNGNKANIMVMIRNFNGEYSSILDSDSSSAEKSSVICFAQQS